MLSEFLERNSIDRVRLERVIYEALILSIFEQIYIQLETGTNKDVLRKMLRAASTRQAEMLLVKGLAESYLGVNLSEPEVTRLSALIFAYLSKSSSRRAQPESFKQKIMAEQDNRCNLCGSPITLSSGHLDHIVPFKYVGDELEDNYQVLCQDCNLAKSTSVFYSIKALVRRAARTKPA